jgi:hypothetical protein
MVLPRRPQAPAARENMRAWAAMALACCATVSFTIPDLRSG